MDKELLLQRLRQLSAVDRNALAIYIALSNDDVDDDIKAKLHSLISDETAHINMENEILALLEK